jgi:hypothetical protein
VDSIFYGRYNDNSIDGIRLLHHLPKMESAKKSTVDNSIGQTLIEGEKLNLTSLIRIWTMAIKDINTALLKHEGNIYYCGLVT